MILRVLLVFLAGIYVVLAIRAALESHWVASFLYVCTAIVAPAIVYDLVREGMKSKTVFMLFLLLLALVVVGAVVREMLA